MYLAELKIENFRGIRSARLALKKRTLLIGPNNVGKTTVLEAAALLLGRDRMIVEPSEWDFYDGHMFGADIEWGSSSPGSGGEFMEVVRKRDADTETQSSGDGTPTSHPRIRIHGVLAALTADEARVFCHPSRAGSLGAWNPKSASFLHREAQKGEEPAVCVAFEAHFDPEQGEVVSKRFFPIDGEDPLAGDVAEPLQRQHVQMAGYFLLSSGRLWKDAVRFTSSLFGRLLRQRQVRTGEQIRRIVQSLETLQPKAQDAEELQELLNGLRETVGRFIPLASEMPLGFEVTDLSSPDVEKALTLFLRGVQDNRRFPMSRHGSAAISVQLLAMLVMLGKHRMAQGASFLLGLEEPELHLHPHAQRNLISAVREDTTQLIASTHSPAITECFKPDEVYVLSTTMGMLSGRYLLADEVKQETKNLVKRWVFTRRRLFAEAVMSPAVLLVEGETESDLLSGLTSLIDGASSLDELGCSVLQCDGSGLPKVLPMIARFTGVRIVLVDGDSAGTGYVEQIKALSEDNQPHLVLQLPDGMGFEYGLAHGVEDNASAAILQRLKMTCAEICVEPPTGSSSEDLRRFLVERDLKKNPLLRDAVADALREAKVVPPIVREIRAEVAGAIAARPVAMRVKRIGSETGVP
jgi:hypothetical protein